MAILAAFDLASAWEMTVNILYVALGLGLVIFFHELGHFAVAKWCGVCVERFSIGFGPILWSFKKSETEYALSAIPFGGYVKMLGQDDMDPSQLSSEEIAEDPRSYSAKSVSQRMAIISAGVIMNVITGVLFFASAFHFGVETSPAVLGSVQVGMPAWKAGLRNGYTITRINGREVASFADIMRGVALTTGKVLIEGFRPDGSTFKVLVTPDTTGTRRMIGVSPTLGLKLIQPDDESIPAIVAGTAAAKAAPPFEPGDIIRKVEQTDVTSFAQLQQIFAENSARTLPVYVERAGHDGLVKIELGTNRFRTLGLLMDIEKITSIQKDSPAEKAGLKPGDKIVSVSNADLTAQLDVGKKLNPLKLPNHFAKLHGKNVKVVVKREVEGGSVEEATVHVTPENIPGWVEKPIARDVPISVPSIGIAFHVTPQVLQVEEGSPAEKAKIQPGSRIKSMELILAKNQPADGLRDDDGVILIELSGDKKNWAFAFWMMQVAATRHVRLTISDQGKPRVVELKPRPSADPDWCVPTRGMRLVGLTKILKADDFAGAMLMGLKHTRNTLFDIYLTLRNLVGGLLSYKELHGPIGIAKVAYEVSKQGMPKLLLFLGFLSVNLAVLNFLPIPVLDGGHMVFLCWEAVTRKRPSERVLIAATYFGMAFVLGLMLLVIYLDIFVHQLGID